MKLVLDDCRQACTLMKWRDSDRRSVEDIETIVIHRIGPKIPEGEGPVLRHAYQVARWFYDNPKYTGGRMPYHFVINQLGEIEQAVDLSLKAPGAVALNKNGIQVSLLGDFRRDPPTPAQALSLTSLCWALQEGLGHLSIQGHTEFDSRATANPGKVCPGKHLNLEGLRKRVAQLADEERAKFFKYQNIKV